MRLKIDCGWIGLSLLLIMKYHNSCHARTVLIKKCSNNPKCEGNQIVILPGIEPVRE